MRVANPLSEDHAILRPVPYPSVLAALAENVRQRRTDVALFEVGKIYRYRPEADAPTGELRQSGGAVHRGLDGGDRAPGLRHGPLSGLH